MTETKQRLARGESPKAACTCTGGSSHPETGNGKRERHFYVFLQSGMKMFPMPGCSHSPVIVPRFVTSGEIIGRV